jgi:tetratricopeptide (TPR) repeat protein
MTGPSTPAQAPARDPRAAAFACAAMLAVLIAAAYAGGLHGAFVFDDLDSIVSNGSIRRFSTSLSPPAGATVSGRPFLNLTFAVNYALGGTSSLGYHALNVAIHIAAALILLGVVRKTLASKAGGGWGPRESLRLAAGAALLWALHPIQVESVGYVVQRAESLMGLLYLLTLYGLIRNAQGGRSATPWAAAAFFSCLLGMATKEAMVTAPVIAFLYDRTFLAGSFSEAWRRRKGFYLLLAACWIPLGVQLAMGSGRSGTAGFGSGVSAWAYFLTQLKAIALYVRLYVWPAPLVGDYGRILAGNTWDVWVSGAFVAGLAAATIVLLVRRPALGFLGAWFFVILAPTSSFVPISTEIIALHRMYLPLAALAVATLLLMRRYLGAGWALTLAITLVAGVLAFVTVQRDRVYAGPKPFWSDVAREAPWNAGAWNNLGLIEAADNNPAAAVADFQHALAIVPNFATAHLNLGKSLLAANRPGEALSELKQALIYLPGDPEIHHQMGKAYAVEHNLGAAVRELHESVALDGDRADVWFDLGVVMEQGGAPALAIEDYQSSIALDPANAQARLNLGNLLVQASRMPEAIVQYEDLVRLEPKAADIHNNLGSLLAESGRLAEAKAEFTEAIRLQPDYAEARDNLAHVSAMLAPEGRP